MLSLFTGRQYAPRVAGAAEPLSPDSAAAGFSQNDLLVRRHDKLRLARFRHTLRTCPTKQAPQPCTNRSAARPAAQVGRLIFSS